MVTAEQLLARKIMKVVELEVEKTNRWESSHQYYKRLSMENEIAALVKTYTSHVIQKIKA